MTTEKESPIVRTSGSRMAKGIAIIVIVMAIGAAINIGMGDFWYKFPPPNQLKIAAEQPTVVTPTGKTVEISLTFVESADLRTLGFNKPAGEEGANPDVEVTVGDKVIIHATNDGKMPHAFGIVSNPEDPNTILFNAKLKSPDNPLLKGESGTVEFIPDKEGEYYYICTVPGHALLGMQGKFIVKKAEGGAGGAAAPVQPTGNKVAFDLSFMESSDLTKLGFNAPTGDANANPPIKVKAGDSVTINVVNNGKMPHAFGIVSNPEDPNTILFNTKLKSPDNPMLKGQTGSITFIADRPGNYFYICTVPGHSLQGMQGNFIVE